jgi:FtsP/CotA-like multicopper oxidase with cupredoxin domain
VIRFRAVSLSATDLHGAGSPIPFHVIGSDQGLASGASWTDTLVVEPGSRYDVVFDFRGLSGQRIIMENIGGDAPFGGAFGDALAPEDFFPDRQTDRIMAFDVVRPLDASVADRFDAAAIGGTVGGPVAEVSRIRRVALFEGKDEFGRLQPLLGTVADDLGSATAYAWFQPATENPDLDAYEEWEIYNFTGDAHPIHLHLVHFEIVGRQAITFEADEEHPLPVLQHSGEYGAVAAISNIAVGGPIDLEPADGYVENAPKDVVTALPEQVTRIRARFDRSGRYVWHCHILSHEDHEMMRVLRVGGA